MHTDDLCSLGEKKRDQEPKFKVEIPSISFQKGMKILMGTLILKLNRLSLKD